MPYRPLSFLGLLLACACAGGQPSFGDERSGPPELLTGPDQRARLCARADRNVVTQQYCAPNPPAITGVADLRAALALGGETTVLDRGFAITGHSTSLVHRSVSSINPRIILFDLDPEESRFAALAYNRGDRFAEIVVSNRGQDRLAFYLVTFSLPCDATAAGCGPADELTPAAETGWAAANLYGEEDLLNTPRDCRVCHQPDGPGTPKILRMQELDAPWNHWFFRNVEGGRALIADYYAAKGDEALAGVPGPDINFSQPGTLRFALTRFTPAQPFPFPSRAIQREVTESAAALGGDQPWDNSVPGQSATWQELYARAKRAEVISVPYHDVKVTDPVKLAAMTDAYQAYRSGALAASELPDIRQVYPDDPQALAEMGMTTEPGMSGEEILLQACGQCHNDRLDQSLSRARFNVDLRQVEPAVRQRAIERINLPIDDPAVMPPALFRRLDAPARRALANVLQP